MFDGYGIQACERFKLIFKTKIKQIKHQPGSIEYQNDLYISFASSLTQALKVRNGNEALDLLLNSERVFTDLRRALDFSERFEVKLILREWNDSIKYEYEFRCFVYQNSLNAISQYDYCFFSEELVKDSEKLKTSISNFFDEVVKNKLNDLENYVIDFGVTKSGEIFIIELNPFNTEEVLIAFLNLKEHWYWRGSFSLER
jgi:hypothetical protein